MSDPTALLMKRQAITLGMANISDFAVQLLTPIVLVRVLDETGFGSYRLLWLAAATLLAIVPLGMPVSLLYFLPRHDLRGQAVFVRQTLLYMAAAAALSALALSPWNPLLPDSLRTMAGADLAAPLFCALWAFSSVLDVLLNAQRRIELQAGLIFGLALLRGASVIAAALLGGINAVIAILALLAATKALLLLVIATARYGRHLWVGGMSRWPEQAKYALPVGANSAVNLLGHQADHWLVVALFGAVQYGVYSIGAAALAVGGVMRAAVSSVIFPEMSRAEAEGDLAKVLSLNKRSNVACALFVVPVLVFLFAAASPLVRLIYTDVYAGAIPVVRLNVVAFLIPIVEMSTVMLVLRQGPFFLRLNTVALIVALLASYAGSQAWGMPGAVVGVIAGNLLGTCVSYARAARLLALPVSALQEWRTLARIAAAAIIAGVAAYGTLLVLPAAVGHVLAIMISAAVFCCTYLASLVGLGQWGMVVRVLALPPDFPHQLRKRLGKIVG
jgi:O-antigen/teichoic acid export membrane protein